MWRRRLIEMDQQSTDDSQAVAATLQELGH